MTLYLAVTADKYELPLYVATSRKEMAKWAGVSGDQITMAMCNYERIWGRHPDKERKTSRQGVIRFTKVEVDD